MKKKSELFSFDLKAYLKKIARFTLRSSLLYSVELLRSASLRGATKVSVRIERSFFEIIDNGMGIGIEDIKKLLDIFDGNEDMAKRVEAVKSLKGDGGTGLLALFSQDYKKISIENSNDKGSERVSVEGDNAEFENVTEISKGTKIIIERRAEDLGEELNLFREFSRWSPVEISLNGKLLKRENSIPGTMVSLKLNNDGGKFKSYCGIPASDDMCKIWFLNKGVVTERKIIPPLRGFIFYAAVETGYQNDGFDPVSLLPEVRKLYLYIAKNYYTVGREKRERIEKLIFFHYRVTLKKDIIDEFSPFELYGKKKFLSLIEIENLLKKNKLFAVRRSESVNGKFGNNMLNTLVLTPNQIDFLINRLGFDITFPEAVKSGSRLFLRTSRLFNYWKDRFLSKISSFFGRELDPDFLWSEERGMLSLANRYFSSGEGRSFLIEYGFDSGEVRMAKGVSFYPLFFRGSSGGLTGRKLYLYLGRNNLLIKRMAQFIEADNRNLEMLKDYLRLEIGRFLKSGD